MSVDMTKQEAGEIASQMRAVGWETVWLEIDDNGVGERLQWTGIEPMDGE
jgi:hypothetical protein